MVIYEINLQIKDTVYSKYIDWLALHIKEMLCFDGFVAGKIFSVLEDEKTCSAYKLVVVHYEIDCLENLNKYLSEHASYMRSQAIKKFDGQFTAERRILTLSPL